MVRGFFSQRQPMSGVPLRLVSASVPGMSVLGECQEETTALVLVLGHGGVVEASSIPTISRLFNSKRHRMPAMASGGTSI